MSKFYRVLLKASPEVKYFTIATFLFLEDARFYIRNELNHTDPAEDERIFKIMFMNKNIELYGA